MKRNKLTALTLACSLSVTSLGGTGFDIKENNQGMVYGINTESKQSIKGDYFVLKLSEAIDSDSCIDSCLCYYDEFFRSFPVTEVPKYLFLQGTDYEIDEIASNAVQYEFNGISDVVGYSNTWDTDVSVFCNEDGSYNIIIWNSYLNIYGEIHTTKLPLVKLSDMEYETLKGQYPWEDKLMKSFVKKRTRSERRQKD